MTYFGLRPRRHSSARGARLLLRRRLLRSSPLSIQLVSRGSPFTSAMTTPAYSRCQLRRLRPKRIFDASATNTGQEGLCWGHGGLTPPGEEVLPGARKRKPEGVVGFARVKAASFSVSFTSTTSTTLLPLLQNVSRRRVIRGDDEVQPVPRTRVPKNQGSRPTRS